MRKYNDLSYNCLLFDVVKRNYFTRTLSKTLKNEDPEFRP